MTRGGLVYGKIDKFFSKVFFMLEIKHTSCFYNAIILSET